MKERTRRESTGKRDHSLGVSTQAITFFPLFCFSAEARPGENDAGERQRGKKAHHSIRFLAFSWAICVRVEII